MSDRIYTIPWQPITYAGIRFKSKLECRWYVFFEALRTVSIYEPKQFYLPEFQNWYIPDFALLSCPFDYIEIKPTSPLPDEYGKCRALSELGFKVALFAGSCNPDVQVYLFENGHRKSIPRTSAFLQQCFQFKLNGRQGETVAALKTVLGKGNYSRAFKAAWEFKV